ncbi:hybrid sensor histidine kinase/response regulator [Neptunicella marina]|uniref:histidine kinase n=1 Tax=Neptunicella marina TaxID=2125989 RepID=A0A8J6M4G0_9ALTE|nr:hybrid sensor histidine kinase/response regulator [Neptunicella marina]MBC3767887.1 response regulator [Neptunicella marina]
MKRWLYWIALLWIACAGNTYAQSVVQLINTEQSIRLSNSFKVLHETDQPLSIVDVIKQQNNFDWPTGNNQNYGMTRKGLWFHMQISNVSNVSQWVMDVAYAQNDIVDFYVVRNNMVIDQARQGKLATHHPYRLPTLELTLDDATPVDIYIRVQSDSVSRVVPIDVQSKSHHTQLLMLDSLLWGLFYGALLVLGIYTLVLYFERKEKSSLAYVGYVLSVVLWQFVWGGHIQMLFNSAVSRWLNDHTDLLFMLVGLNAAVFTLSFLNAKQTAPRSYQVIRIVIGCLILLALISMLGILEQATQNMLVYAVSIMGITTYLIAGFESYAGHNATARYFIFAWSILLTCALVGMLGLVGILPSNPFTTYCFQVGVCIEAALFSIAILDKSRQDMENEIASYTREMRQNLELIEEKNAHLDIARKDAIRASEVKSQFLANVSHEIRTPLNAILGFSKELQSSGTEADRLEHAKIVNSAATNLLLIINDVLDFSKIEAGKLQVSNEPFSPLQLLDELTTLMAKTAQDKGLEFIFESDELPGKLVGDASRIRQVLTNLLGNAIKFTKQGHVRLQVGCRQEHNSMWLTFQVEDTGIGISANQRKVLFKAFSQVDDALNREFQGTGLGLVISQQLTQLMNGRIEVESETGRGSLFTATIRTQTLKEQENSQSLNLVANKTLKFYEPYPSTHRAQQKLFAQLDAIIVPLEAQQEVDYLFWSASKIPQADDIERIRSISAKRKVLVHPMTFRPSQHPELGELFEQCLEKPLSRSKFHKLFEVSPQKPTTELQSLLKQLPEIRILAVDDMEFNLRLLSTWLKNSPVQLHTSLSGQDAVSRCEKEEFDLILMDLQMPNMDGVKATRLIRQSELNQGTPIIVVTAHVFKEEQEKLMESGMDDYLAKPIELGALVNLIHRWCQVPEQQNKSVDWQLAVQQSHDNEQLACQMLQDFLQALPEHQQKINQAAITKNYPAYQQEVHALHGLCCYTGVPKLQALCHDLEVALKENDVQLADCLLDDFNQECAQVLDTGSQFVD